MKIKCQFLKESIRRKRKINSGKNEKIKNSDRSQEENNRQYDSMDDARKKRSEKEREMQGN